MSATLDPAWVLSQRPYGNSGRLVEFFSLAHGRCGAVARGVHRKAPGGQPAQLLQPFQPLLIEVRGRGELKTLSRVEPAGLAHRLSGNTSLCGLYLNELLLRVLPRFDAHPTLFAQYGAALEVLDDGRLEPALRRFELDLLRELGYHMIWDCDAEGAVIDAQSDYQFLLQQGFVPTLTQVAACRGEHLLEIATWLEGGVDTLSAPAMTVLKAVNRQALAPLLGDRPLQTRLLAMALNRGGEAS